MPDFIEETFAELDEFYPQSKRKRRVQEKKVEVVSSSWEDEYYEKLIGGVTRKLYTLGSLAKALNRSPKTLRQWMDDGKFPSAPYRLPDTTGSNGKVYAGRRLYSKAMVDAVVKIFASAGLLNADRVDWDTHRNLVDKVAEAWEQIRADELNY
jgi:hypothetical protein